MRWHGSIKGMPTGGTYNVWGTAVNPITRESYTCGDFYGTLTFGGLPPLTTGSNSGAWYIVKYAWDGTPLKAVKYAGDDVNSNDICKRLYFSTYDGFLYATGENDGLGTYPTNPPTVLNTQSAALVYMKVNPDTLLPVWVKGVQGVNYGPNDGANIYGNGLAAAPGGGMYISGNIGSAFSPYTFQDGVSLSAVGSFTDNAYLVKIGADGKAEWGRVFQTTGFSVANAGVCVDANGMVYVTGAYRGALTVPGTSLTGSDPGSRNNPFLAKFSPTGDGIWFTRITVSGGQPYGYSTGIATLADGATFITGVFDSAQGSTVDAIISTPAGDLKSNAGSVFVVRVAPNGTITSGMNCGCNDWTGFCEPDAAQADWNTNTVYIGGDFDPNFLWKGALFTETGTFGDGFVFSVDGTTAAAGEIQLFKSPRYVDVSNINLDSYGALYVGGYFDVSATIGTSTFPDINPNDYNGFFFKLYGPALTGPLTVTHASLKTHRRPAAKVHKPRQLASLNHNHGAPKNKTAHGGVANPAARDRWAFKGLLNETTIPGAVDYMVANGFTVSLTNAHGDVIDSVAYGPGSCTTKSSSSRRLSCQATSVTGRLSLAPRGPAKRYGDKSWTVDGAFDKRTTGNFEMGSMPLKVAIQFDATVVQDSAPNCKGSLKNAGFSATCK